MAPSVTGTTARTTTDQQYLFETIATQPTHSASVVSTVPVRLRQLVWIPFRSDRQIDPPWCHCITIAPVAQNMSEPSKVLFFQDLSCSCTADDLVHVCARFGVVRAVRMLNKRGAKLKAAVEMDSTTSAQAVLAAKPTINGVQLRVSLSTVWTTINIQECQELRQRHQLKDSAPTFPLSSCSHLPQWSFRLGGPPPTSTWTRNARSARHRSATQW